MRPVQPLFRHFSCVLFMAVALHGYAQWEDVSLDYLIESSTFGSLFGCGLSTADFNGDGWDDVTTAGSDGWIKLYTGGPDGFVSFEAWQMPTEGKAVLWIDIENDGDLDLFVGFLHLGVFLYVQQEDGTLIEQGLQRGMPVLQSWDVRGFSARDYDRDGDLDLYVASYHDAAQTVNYENMLFQNGGNGFFEDVTLFSGTGNGMQHSFQGAWYDYDNDGFDDLWVINDRSVFPNALYHNLGNGTFEDIAEDVGCDIGIEAMSATLFDPDNDGDWDQYITNIEGNPNAFLRNNEGQYVDIAESAGVASLLYGWGTCAIDVDGDRWDDMMVATYRFPNTNPYDNHLYMNLGSGTEFLEETENWPNEQFQLYCLGRLDLDGDRVPDLVGHGNAAHAQVLRNTNSEGAARLAINLIGTESNTYAVGSVIKVHAAEMTQMQQVEAGCDYMTQHSYTRFFALGDVQVIDSIEVFWPLGSRDVLFDVPSDTALLVIEGFLDAELEPLEAPCPWSPPGWSIPFELGSADMTWNGEPVTSEVVVADSTGDWTFEASWWGGGYTWSQTVSWTEVALPDLAVEVTPASCHGALGGLAWTMPDGASVMLLDSVYPSTVNGVSIPAGDYDLEVELGENCTVHVPASIGQPEALSLELEVTQPACHGDHGMVTWSIGGGTPPLAVVIADGDPLALTPGEWPIVLEDSMGCTLSDAAVVVEPDSLISSASVEYAGPSDSALVTLVVEGGTPPFNVAWSGPIDTSGWVVAPVGLGWFVQDANGCLDLGVLDVPSNPLAAVGGFGRTPWSCFRDGVQLRFSGPGDALVEVRVFDLSGRLLLEEVHIAHGQVIELGHQGVVVVQALDVEGRSYAWVK